MALYAMTRYLLQNPTGIKEEVAIVVEKGVCLQVADLQTPDAVVFVPLRPFNLMLSLDQAVHVLFLTNAAKVVLNLGSWGEETRPLRVWPPGKLIVVRWNIAFAPWVAIFVPCTADNRVLLVDDVLIVSKMKSQCPYHVHAAHSGSDADNSKMARSSQRLLNNFIFWNVITGREWIASVSACQLGCQLVQPGRHLRDCS